MFLSEFVGDWVYTFSLEKIDEVFIRVGGFFPDVFLWEEVGMCRVDGCFSLYNLVFSIVVRGSVCVVQDINCSSCPVNYRVDFF